MAEFKNFSINQSTGKFSTKKNEPTEGYVKEEWSVGDKSGITYKKYYDKLEGQITKIERKIVELDKGRLDNIAIYFKVDEDNVHVLEVPVMSSKGDFSDWIKELIKVLGGLNIGTSYEVSLNSSKKDKKGYFYKNIYFKEVISGENVKWQFDPKEAPEWEKQTIKKLGVEKVVYSKEKQDEFYFEHLEKALNKFKKEQPIPQEEPVEYNNGGKDDDLPF